MNKEKVKRTIKSLIPWRLRYFIKLQEAKGNIQLSENIKQFRPIGQYNEELYSTLKDLKIRNFNGKTVCELGPGQHLSHAFLEYQMGAEKEWLLEIDDFAYVDSPAKPEDITIENGYGIQKQLPTLSDGESWKSYLDKINATYSINGLDGYKDVPDNSVDYCFSYAVFEHIRKRVFRETIQEMYRFMRHRGICYHVVDFTDHMGGGKNHLRFPESVWEDEDHYKMDNYTNRIQCSEMCKMLKDAGFEIIGLKKQRYRKFPLRRKHITGMLEKISDDDLLTAKVKLIIRKS